MIVDSARGRNLEPVFSSFSGLRLELRHLHALHGERHRSRGRSGDLLVVQELASRRRPGRDQHDDPGITTHVFPSVQANKHGDVYVAWLDRRTDPGNRLTDTWAAVSRDRGATFGHNTCQTDISTDWFTREDSRPDYGDYNSSDLLGFNQFVTTWADGRFPPGVFRAGTTPPNLVGRRIATPDTLFTIAQGLGVGNSQPDLTC